MDVLRRAPLFKLCTTSFIYPDHIIPNIRKLGRRFDEIELLVFESMPIQVLPTESDIAELVQLSRTLDVTYNVHLPLDICLTDPDAKNRQAGVKRLAHIMELCRPLAASTHTLHLDYTMPDQSTASVKKWQRHVFDAMDRLVAAGVDPETISVETLDYPFDFLEETIDRVGVRVCLDIGHALCHGYDPDEIFKKHMDRVAVIHLHGVDMLKIPAKDHVSLDRMPPDRWSAIKCILDTYDGVVSVEVFDLTRLLRSLEFLGRYYTGMNILER
jgi:sugar phosphate isomerase/epimerase